MSDVQVVCFARKVFDGWTGKQTGWMYGGHIWGDNAPEQCPTCGDPRPPKDSPHG